MAARSRPADPSCAPRVAALSMYGGPSVAALGAAQSTAMKRFAIRAILLATLLTPLVALAQNIEDPSDPLYADQWALAHIGAACAWGYTIGNPNVTVAVVDSGVDLGHPDLVDRLRTDGDDFVDGDDDPTDENGHGTNVAGIIAATLDNAEGGAGLAPGVQILPVRVMNARGSGSDRSIARGIRFSADQGAQVINLSLGATLTIGAETEFELVSAAIRYAQDKGSLVVVAAGNDFVPLPNAIIGDNPDVLVVAATDDNDRKAAFSNSGPWISVTAPGVHILSTMPTYEVYLTSDEIPEDERFHQDYDYMSGTSQATPFVAALAALLFSEHPDWDARQVAEEIKSQAADISRQNRRLVEKGYLGSGRIDACKALGGQAAQQPGAEPSIPAEPGDGLGTEPSIPAEPGTGLVTEPGVPAAPGGAAGARLGSDRLLILGVLVCGAVLLLGVMLFSLLRVTRRPAAAPAAVPVYAPPPAVGSTQPYQVASAPVAMPAPAQSSAWGLLVVIAGPSQARSYPLAGPELQIGRGDDCAILLLEDGTISRRHAVVRNDGRQVTVEDVGSSHGTYLNGQQVAGPVQVRRGDVLQVGQTQLRFE